MPHSAMLRRFSFAGLRAFLKLCYCIVAHAFLGISERERKSGAQVRTWDLFHWFFVELVDRLVIPPRKIVNLAHLEVTRLH